jgi:multidrug resistance efflux pump
VVALQVRAGDKVHAGQVLMRIDARAADQTAAAGRPRPRRRARLEVATREFERQQQLFAQGYHQPGGARPGGCAVQDGAGRSVRALANAGAARTQSDFYVVKAPYGGVVANVSVCWATWPCPDGRS